MEQRGCFARHWTMIGIVLVAFVASAKCQNISHNGKPTKPPKGLQSWGPWGSCSGGCSVKLQLRNRTSQNSSNERELQLRPCITSNGSECTGYTLEIVRDRKIFSKAKLMIEYNNGSWETFCHPSWNIDITHEVCRAYGFPAAEVAYELEGDREVDNNCSGNHWQQVASAESCYRFEEDMKQCHNVRQAFVVCKVPVSLSDDTFFGTVLVSLYGEWMTISAEYWEIKDADVVCRQLGFKRALAPFSRRSTSLAPDFAHMCITVLRCRGDEASLSFCPFKYTRCVGQSKYIHSSVTCEPNSTLHSSSRHAILAKQGEHKNWTCRLSNDTPVAWLDENNQTITNTSRHSVMTPKNNELVLFFSSITLSDAGVYTCIGAKEQEFLVVYVQVTFNTSTRTIKEGKEGVISCGAVGFPLPIVWRHWLKNGLVIDNRRFTMTETGSLRISRVERGDEGNYSCIVSQAFENRPKIEKVTFPVVLIMNMSNNTCSGSPCKNGGRCKAGNINYTCICLEGQSGSFCEITTSPTFKSGPETATLTAGQSGQNEVALIVTLTVVSFLLVFVLGFFCIRHRRHLTGQRNDAHHNATRNPVFEGLEKDQDSRYLSLSATSWEISPKGIDLHNILGSGTFGEVWKAIVVGLRGAQGTTTVAVKKLKHNSSDSEKESLAQEIELGQSLNGDRHPNIVNCLGCVSTSVPMMLVLEYAPYGDLLGYLRKSRGMEDKYYSCPETCQQEVTPYDLLLFSQQIASGMSFLASKNILHRDLAARNVLVGEGRICKITDFGLALIRDKYQYLYCTAIRKGRLPIKWTAPEHLFTDDTEGKDVRVSEKSDVWSYGIVLYEIFTLGGVPYPGWGEWKVVYELKVNKYRMTQPQHVTEEIYHIMLDCWNEDPNSRPTFDGLHEMTTAFLQDEHYIDLDMSKYEASLYANVDEIDAAVTQATDPTANDASVNRATADPSETVRSSAFTKQDTPL